ncbi:hypothetical protein GGQ80_000614 [Sphingomonas jinjuensis]|uniref:Uncharacterized protein n=1 Tax=Sphingomonas jinjuensis TaxID=535907 RepID=A0A840FFG6_9SPHN|nr:hypothetical protein [Sphingomonas jinjuensis]MBB4152738.1 hypothetical protein [Sphingomonas jinjuensis]
MTAYHVMRAGLGSLGVLMLTLAPATDALSQRRAAAAPSRPSAEKESAPALNAEAVAEARRELDNNLLDYPRARFRTVRLVQSSKRFKAFCGDINVTNRMGGYNGWQPFVLPLGKDGVAGLYDKPTITGQPTTIGSVMSKYGQKSSVSDIAGRQVSGACGSDATRLDDTDYAAALSYDRQGQGSEPVR